MNNRYIFLLVIVYAILQSCDSQEDPINQVQTFETITSILTNDDSKTWKIQEAYIFTGTDSIDISNNYNVYDDEIVLTNNGSDINLEWRRGFEIKIDTHSSTESLSDNYLSVLEFILTFNGSKSTFQSTNGEVAVKVINEDSVTLIFDKNDIENDLVLKLVEKKESDYASPKEELIFNHELTIELNSLSVRAPGPGMIGSHTENSLFIANREAIAGVGSVERVTKFNLSNGNKSEYSFQQADFVSKELCIVDDKLIVAGGQYINSYDLNISNEPLSVNHGKLLSRFGMASVDNNTYIIGGDFNNIESDKIFIWNSNNQTISEFTNMPEPRSGAKATIVNDNLYVFGGTEEFFGYPAKNSIYIVPLSKPSETSTITMDQALNFTFISKYQNLIYVAGIIIDYDENGSIVGADFIIGVFNTIDNSFKELSHNLPNTSGNFLIHQMVVLNKKLYVLYGDYIGDWSIMSATID